jgi:hypothetical protein
LFKRNSPYETYQAVIECAVAPPSQINNQLDPAIDEVVMRAVTKDKEKRYPSAEAFGDAMLSYLHHRGKGSGGNELGRFFEEHFGQELEEHGERMRELIAGRDTRGSSGWDENDGANQTVDLSGKKDEESMSLATGELMEVRPSNASLDSFVGHLGEDQDPDALPSDKTNIVQNPLEMIEQLNQQVARNASGSGKFTPVPSGTATGLTGAAPLPAPPTGPRVPVEQQKPSDKFPELANMPTQMGAQKPAPPPSFMDPAQAGPNSSTHYAIRQSSMHPAQQPLPAPPPTIPPPNLSVTAPAPVISDYPVLPGGQRPFSTDLAPSNLSQRPMYPTGPFDPAHAANVMSPVGDQYPQTDWERAAAMSAKALPPWMLVALFGAALVGALLLTLAIAKIFS